MLDTDPASNLPVNVTYDFFALQTSENKLWYCQMTRYEGDDAQFTVSVAAHSLFQGIRTLGNVHLIEQDLANDQLQLPSMGDYEVLYHTNE